MSSAIFPALVLTGTFVAGYYAMQDPPADQNVAVKLNVNGREADAVTPYLHAAAKQLGHSKVRSYESGVFITGTADNTTIAFVETKDGMELQVGFESKYRIPAAERRAALAKLKQHGEDIFAKAQDIRAREAIGGAVATVGAARPNG